MPNKKATGSPIVNACLAPKGSRSHAPLAQAGIILTSAPSSLTLQPLDKNGNPVTLTPSDKVAGTLASDSTSFGVIPGVDSTHYIATIPANTPLGTVVNLSATMTGTIGGAAADLTASLPLTLNIPPVPVATDLEIILG
jgi:hypothetical protein